MHSTAIEMTPEPVRVCGTSDLVADGGICCLVDGKQIAVFYLPKETPALYAIGNRDPIGDANVLSRGIVGDVGSELVVASPLYKQHFSLTTGRCLEDGSMEVPIYRVAISNDDVLLYL